VKNSIINIDVSSKFENGVLGKLDLIANNATMSEKVEDLANKLQSIKKNVRSPLAKETLDNLIEYGEKFGNRDVLFLDVSKGVITKTPSNIATSVEGKSRMQIASFLFGYLQILKPTKNGQRLALQRHIANALERSRTPNEFATNVYKYPDLSPDSRSILKSLINNNNKILRAKNEQEKKLALQKAQEEQQKLLEKQRVIQEEIDNFKTPNIHELNAVSSLSEDNRFASFSQLITDIKKQRATPVQIEQYVKAKHNIKPDVLEKSILKLKYPINSNAVEKLENLIKYDKAKVDEIINENEYKALIYNLKKDKLPNTTADMENRYKDKFYKLNKLYDEIKSSNKGLDGDVKIDFDALNKFAEPLEKSDSILKVVNDFKNPIKTPIGELKINMDYMLNKALERDNKARLEVIGYIKPTLQRPAYIINVDNKLHFIKPFIDEKDNTKKFLSVIPNRNNDVIMITSTIIQDRDIKRIINNGEVIKDFIKLEAGSTKLAPVPARADLNSPKASNSIDKSMKENIPSQSLKNTEDLEAKKLSNNTDNISYEEALKKGLIPFANKDTLGGGFFGGSEALYNQRDWNNDGVFDEQDIAIGVIGGVIGFKALAKIFPSWFKETNVSNTINSNRLNKEKKNISKVAFGKKPSTIIRTYDKDSLDKFITDSTKQNNNIEFEKGGFNEYTKKGVGFEKIAIRHMQDGSDGYISLDELTKIGKVIRDGEFKLKNNGLREYTYFDKDIRYKAIVGDKSNNERVVSFYSNRRGKGHDARILFGNPPKDTNTGLGHDAKHYTLSTNTDGIIITYKPKTTFKQWLLDLKKQSKEIKEDLNSLKSEDKDTKIGAFVGSKVNEQSTIEEFKEHIKDLKELATKEELKHLVKQSWNGVKHIANNSKEVAKKLNTGVNRNIATKEALKQNNQNIKRSERRYKNR